MGMLIELSGPFAVTLPREDDTIDFVVTIKASSVTVDCESSAPMTARLFEEAYFGSKRLVDSVLSLLCFKNGWGLTFAIETWTDPLGVNKPIPVGEPAVAGICTSLDDAGLLGAPLALVGAQSELAEALHDLTQALVQRENTVINCARAVDGVKHLLAPGLKDKAQWAVLQDALNLDQAYLQVISDASSGPRHGNRGTIAGKLQTLVLQRSWEVMNRYLAFQLRNAGPLRPPEFPLLTG
jgi:hypothetical protein